jgi:replicative DNA helicase
MSTVDDINSLESEAGIIASLIHKPEFIFYSEDLLPNHFTNKENRCVYTAIQSLVEKGIMTIDPYNIIESLNSSEATRGFAQDISIEQLNELVEMSDVLARNTIAEYKMLVKNVLDAAFRRDTFQKLKECQALCYDRTQENVMEKIYNNIDDVMTEFSTTNDVPAYKDVIDGCWEEIKSRQNNGYSGIKFKFDALNDYATIEPGELFIFAAEAKQGKSMMLLNCAVDLLRQDKAVLYLDSELNTRLFTARILAHIAKVEYKRLTAGAYDNEEAERINEALEWLKSKKFTHLYIPMFDQQTIYTAVKKVQHTQGLDVLIVDYFKGSGDGDAFDSYQELGRFVDMVKNRICGEMGIAGIGAAQATATGKVADSAKIGRNASTIAIIQDKTPEEVDLDGAECGNKKLRVILNRNGMQHAAGEYIDLQFNGNLISYEQAKQHIPVAPY